MADDATAVELTEVVWPGAQIRRGAGRHGGLRLLPSADRPRLVLPPGRRAAAAAFATRTSPRHRRERIRNRTVELLLRAGLGDLLARDYLVPDPRRADLVEHLSDVLGRPLAAGVHLGPPRANRKPVLALVSTAGEVVAFAKVGRDALTDRLVAREATALAALGSSRLDGLQVPTLLYHGRWQERECVVGSALHLPRRSVRPGDERIAVAAHTIATLGPTEATPGASLVDGLLRDGFPDLAAASRDDRDALVALVAEAGELLGEVVLELGGAHGDFAPGNVVAGASGPIYVIDWERYEPSGIPVGSDLLHYRFRRMLDIDGRDLAAAAGATVRSAPGLLARMGIAPAAAQLTAGLYLARIARRYLVDGQAGPGRRLGPARPWLEQARNELARRRVS